MSRHIQFRQTIRDFVQLAALVSMLTLSTQVAAQEELSHESLCGFTMRPTNEWHKVPHARSVGLERIPSTPTPIYYQNGSASMVVYCAPRFRPRLDFESSVAREVSAISHSYTDFSIIGNDRIEFQTTPAQWFLFSGSLKLQPAAKRGYMIVADRGERSLVIALSDNVSTESNSNALLFRSAVQLFSLQ